MVTNDTSAVEKKLDEVVGLLKHLLALELLSNGVPRQEIAKQLHVATATVSKMLSGVGKE